jgi:hypothetical protein
VTVKEKVEVERFGMMRVDCSGWVLGIGSTMLKALSGGLT